MYQCDEMMAFVRSCVDKYEKLDPTVICQTLENFFKMYVKSHCSGWDVLTTSDSLHVALSHSVMGYIGSFRASVITYSMEKGVMVFKLKLEGGGGYRIGAYVHCSL